MRFYDHYNAPTKVLLCMIALVDVAGVSVLVALIAGWLS